MNEALQKFPRITIRDALKKFRKYVRDLELTDGDLSAGKSICVIGSGDNSFAAGLKHVRGHRGSAFVMGVDSADDKYHQLDSAVINHDARDLGFPEDFEGFDLVISYHAVPKYFLAWGDEESDRKAFIESGAAHYDYAVADKKGTDQEIFGALYTSFSEMLRIAKPGGRVKIYPIEVHGSSSYESEMLDRVIHRLQQDYPGLESHYFGGQTTDANTSTAMRRLDVGQSANTYCGLELVRPMRSGSDLNSR